MQKFAVFVSGNGSNLQAIMDAVKAKKIKAELALVFCDNHKAYALKRAKAAGIKTLVLEKKNYATPQSYDRDIVISLKREEIDFVVLAGYMKLLTPYFIKKYPQQILNVHPSLLPSFKGRKGIKDAFTYGVKVTGVTIHIVDDKMDHGPIIMQEGFKIPPNDTLEVLEKRIHALEHKMYPKAIQLFVDGRVKIRGRKVKILEKDKG